MVRWRLSTLLVAALGLCGCAGGASWNPQLWGRESARRQIAAMRQQADQYREQGDAAQRAGDRRTALYYWQESAYLQTRANQTEATLH
ncbi:MAG TPA: hypothetical protein VMV15_09935 [Candidatus Binataceae bacterium]|nr:hypothetical protein [Candidatus Binataceae bacterium]